MKQSSADKFERNFSGQKGVRNVPITVKERNGRSLNPFLSDMVPGEAGVDCSACTVSTQTEVAVQRRDNCKLM